MRKDARLAAASIMSVVNDYQSPIDQAAQLIAKAEYLLIAAGAGMGVDSGLPDFRGTEGFWTAYPALRGMRFEEMSTPFWFERKPERAWGFFAHRLQMYRDTQPHVGFEILQKWCERFDERAFVVTSNVDGQFQKAGFDRHFLLEVHGTIHRLQCCRPCCRTIWPYDDWIPEINEEELLCTNSLPHCIQCRRIARPNILMFNDYQWLPRRTEKQTKDFRNWLNRTQTDQLVILEIGAGRAVRTIRNITESLSAPLIRINPFDAAGDSNCISIALPAALAIQAIQDRILSNT